MITRSQMSSATLGSKNEEGTRKRKRPDSLGSKNEEGTRKRKRPDSLDIDVDRSNENGSLPGISIQSTEKSDETWKETSIQKSAETWTGTFARTFASICRIFSKDEDIMDRSKESQSRPGSVQRNRIARTQEDAESTIPTGRLSPSLFPKEDRMDLSKQLQSRRESDHSKKEDGKNSPSRDYKDKANADPVKLNSMKEVLGVRTHDFTKDARSSIYNSVVTDDCSASSPPIKTISQQPTGKQTFVIAKEGDIIDLLKRQTRRKSVQKKRLARQKEEDRIDRSKRHSRRVSGHQKTPACIREEEERINLSICYTGKESERQIQQSRKEIEERKMDLVNQFKTRRLSEHQKQEACNREEEDINDLEQYYQILMDMRYGEQYYQIGMRYGEIKESKYTCRGSLGDLTTETRRFRSKDVTLPGLCNIADNQPVPIVWAPPPPPDPPNPN